MTVALVDWRTKTVDLVILVARCAFKACRAVWRLLPIFLARFLRRRWRTVAEIPRGSFACDAAIVAALDAVRARAASSYGRSTRSAWSILALSCTIIPKNSWHSGAAIASLAASWALFMSSQCTRSIH